MTDDTRCVTRVPVNLDGYDSLTVPVHRASTIRYADAESFTRRFERGPDGYTYGLYGTPTHRHLEMKLTELEGGVRTVLAPSGQAAITMAFLTILKTGDRVLLPDTVYGPVRDFAAHELAALGIAAEYYDPCDLAALAPRVPGATLVWTESPGSLTMEMQDIAAITQMAHAAGALVGSDNTWASPLTFRPLDHGVDLVVEALSKHFGGHSDVLMGSVTVRDEDLGLRLKRAFGRLGIGVSPDDCALVCRGIDTLAVRLARAAASGLTVARWLARQPHVARILHPALPGAPGHDLWRRDFTGAAGVFSVVFSPEASPHLLPALDALSLISIGASWGGTKSLVAPSAVHPMRTATRWDGPEHVLRLSIGMEDPQDLIADLAAFVAALDARAGTSLRAAATS
ncbi:trans-sulfuration enzyme family protein [Acuticoccus kandeliae]|uniref:trans-sulfuration enzyme family protein n=1 Tax=Acuticoccus kandeliae TaxID=2073160 RepID=UPI000D3E1B87|nr:PLP-dependent transferase [Acuticoccus kandeliae]